MNQSASQVAFFFEIMEIVCRKITTSNLMRLNRNVLLIAVLLHLHLGLSPCSGGEAWVSQ